MSDKKWIGLTEDEVKSRIQKGQVNKTELNDTITVGKILRNNAFTLFNFINVFIAVLILTTGSFKNVLFLGVVISNFLIGSIQAIKTKRTLDKIALITTIKVKVLRNHTIHSIAYDEVVMDDIVLYTSGSQIVSDCKIVEGIIEVNESLLTGESDPVEKRIHDEILSGSFVVSGMAYAQVIRCGDDNYANRIVKDAKQMNQYPSVLRDTLERIVRIISIWIIPVGLLLFYQSYLQGDYTTAILRMSAAVIGMIPEGLIILTSIALAVGILNVSKYDVLIQELYCLETLARVDILCLDKTGTITKGNLKVVDVIPYVDDVDIVMGNYMRVIQDNNASAKALADYFLEVNSMEYVSHQAFSSHRGYSCVHFKEKTYRLGKQEEDTKDDRILRYTEDGYRIMALYECKQETTSIIRCLAYIILEDEIKEDANKTLAYFEKQDVQLKIISGDNPETVYQISKKVGLQQNGKAIDVSQYTGDFDDIVDHQIFGRVLPQKKKEIILALKKQGHTVAMVGDGVNDVQAFKSADISIAMAQGSDVAKASANVVLLHNNFEALPHIVNEGRRVINNIESVATLFLTKTTISFLLSLFVVVLNVKYPFVPIQLTLVSTLTIGIPSFLLALQPNFKRIEGKFMDNIMSISIPSGISVIFAWFFTLYLYRMQGLHESVYDQLNFLILSTNGILVLYYVSKPFNPLRSIIFILVLISLILSIVFFHSFFELQSFDVGELLFPFIIICLILTILRKGIKVCVNYVYVLYQQRV